MPEFFAVDLCFIYGFSLYHLTELSNLNLVRLEHMLDLVRFDRMLDFEHFSMHDSLFLFRKI